MAHTPTIPPRIAAWLEHFRIGAAQAYTGRWYLSEGAVRVLLPWEGSMAADMQICCCPLTAQYSWEYRPTRPLDKDFYASLHPETGLSGKQLDTVAAAADGQKLKLQYRDSGVYYTPDGLSPLERAIRVALVAAVHLREEA